MVKYARFQSMILSLVPGILCVVNISLTILCIKDIFTARDRQATNHVQDQYNLCIQIHLLYIILVGTIYIRANYQIEAPIWFTSTSPSLIQELKIFKTLPSA